MDQTQTTRYVSRFEPLLYVPAFTQKDFYYVHIGPPTKGISTEKFVITNLKYTTLSNTTTSTQEGQGTKPNQNHLYIRRTRHKAKLQSPLYKRDRHKAKNTITPTQEGQGTKPNHNHLYTRGKSHKAKT